MNPSRFFWGIIVVIVGLLLMAGNLGLIPSGFWQQLWRFWPLVLIILGAGFIFGKESRSGWFLASVVILMLFLAGALIWWGYNLPEISTSETLISENYYLDVTDLEVDINYGAADLIVAETSADMAVVGSINSFGEPNITKEVKEGKEKIVVN